MFSELLDSGTTYGGSGGCRKPGSLHMTVEVLKPQISECKPQALNIPKPELNPI